MERRGAEPAAGGGRGWRGPRLARFSGPLLPAPVSLRLSVSKSSSAELKKQHTEMGIYYLFTRFFIGYIYVDCVGI